MKTNEDSWFSGILEMTCGELIVWLFVAWISGVCIARGVYRPAAEPAQHAQRQPPGE